MVGYDVKKNEAYFRAAWKSAVELCVYLCKLYNLTEKDILSHAEALMARLKQAGFDTYMKFD